MAQRPAADPGESLPTGRSVEDRFADFLQSRGMRQTRQRQIMLRIAFSQPGHFSAENLLDQLPGQGQPGHVSRPTVYRTLSEFVEAGLLRKFELEGRSVYEQEQNKPQLDHLYCVLCERLTEFRSDDLARVRIDIANEHRFQIHSHRLIIRGVCAECRQRRRREQKPVDRV